MKHRILLFSTLIFSLFILNSCKEKPTRGKFVLLIDSNEQRVGNHPIYLSIESGNASRTIDEIIPLVDQVVPESDPNTDCIMVDSKQDCRQAVRLTTDGGGEASIDLHLPAVVTVQARLTVQNDPADPSDTTQLTVRRKAYFVHNEEEVFECRLK